MSEKLKEAADALVEDLNMLMDGRWQPDADSCQASIDNAVLLADAIPALMPLVDALGKAIRALNSIPSYKIPTLGMTSYDLLPELERAYNDARRL